MNTLAVGATINAQNKITSFEVLEQINLFRAQEGNRAELRHDNLLAIIRDEFSDEQGILKILETPYTHPQNGQTYPMFELTLKQARQILLRESKFVRRAVLDWIDELESSFSTAQPLLPPFFVELLANVERKQHELTSAKRDLLRAVERHIENPNLPLSTSLTSGIKPYPTDINKSGLPYGVQPCGEKFRVTMRGLNGRTTYYGSFKTVAEAQMVAEKVYYARQTQTN